MTGMSRRAKYVIYMGRGGRWRWRLVAVNGATVADGAEGYATSSNARRAVRRVRVLGALARVFAREA